jgi:hypothetical protein
MDTRAPRHRTNTVSKADDVGELDNLDDEDVAEDAEEDADDKDDETAGDEGIDDGYSE